MGVKLGNGKWAIKEDKLLAYNDNSGRFFNKEFDFSRGSSATYVAKDGLIKTAGLQATNLVNNGDFSELGSELVLNGNFDTDSNWIKGTGWSISGGKASCDGSQTANSVFYQFIGSQSNKIIKLSFSVSDYVSGTLETSFFGASGTQTYSVTSNGNYVFYVNVQSGHNGNTGFTARVGFQGSIDNVSVKQVDPNDYWTLGTGWSFGEDKAVFTSGTSGILFQSNIVETGKLYKLTFDVIRTSGFITSVFLGGVSDNTDINESGSYTYYITSINQDVLGFNADSTFNGSVSNISVQEIQADTPRIDFSDSVKGALLLEPQSTNLLPYSEYFTQWTNTGSETTDTSNALISPSGLLNATKLQEANSNFGYHRLTKSITASSSTDYSLSFFAKKGTISYVQLLLINTSNSETSSKVFDLENGVIGETILYGSGTLSDAKIEDFGNGWYRCSIVAQLTTTPNTFRINLANAATGNTTNLGMVQYTGNSNGNIYIWGAQMEQLSYPTSYIPTFGSTATRLADVCNNSGSAQDFNDSEGVIYCEFSSISNDSFARYVSISDGTLNERVVISKHSASNTIRVFIKSGGGFSATIDKVVSDITDFNKIAFRYKSGDSKLFVNGSLVNTSTDTFSITGLNVLQFANGITTTNRFYGNVRELQVFTEALTDEQLEKLTTI